MPNNFDAILYQYDYITGLNLQWLINSEYDYTSIYGSSPHHSSHTGIFTNRLIGFNQSSSSLNVYKNNNGNISSLINISLNSNDSTPNIVSFYNGVEHTFAFYKRFNGLLQFYYGNIYSGSSSGAVSYYGYSYNRILGDPTKKLFVHESHTSSFYLARWVLGGSFSVLAGGLSFGSDSITLHTLDTLGTNSVIWSFKDTLLYKYFEATNTYSLQYTFPNYGDLYSSGIFNSNTKILNLNQGGTILNYFELLNSYSGGQLLQFQPIGNAYIQHHQDDYQFSLLYSRMSYKVNISKPSLFTASLPSIPQITGSMSNTIQYFSNASGLGGTVASQKIQGNINKALDLQCIFYGRSVISGVLVDYNIDIKHAFQGKVGNLGNIHKYLYNLKVKAYSGGILKSTLPELKSTMSTIPIIKAKIKTKVPLFKSEIIGTCRNYRTGNINSNILIKTKSFYGEVIQ